MPEQIISNLAHIPEYAILTFLWLKAFLARDFKGKHGLILIGLTAFSILDEMHQSFVPGRSASCIDIGLDVIGIFLGFKLNTLCGLCASTEVPHELDE